MPDRFRPAASATESLRILHPDPDSTQVWPGQATHHNGRDLMCNYAISIVAHPQRTPELPYDFAPGTGSTGPLPVSLTSPKPARKATLFDNSRGLSAIPLPELIRRSTESQRGTSRMRCDAPFGMLDTTDRETLPAGLADAYPMTTLQQGMLYEILRNPKRLPYHNCVAILLEDIANFTEENARRAVKALSESRVALRTSLHIDGFSQPMQLVHGSSETSVSYQDWREQPDPSTGVRSYVRGQAATPIDHTTSPLTRFGFFRTSDHAGYISVTYSHAVLDSSSAEQLIYELASLLNGNEPDSECNSLPTLVALEKSVCQDDETAGFWRRTLAGVTGLQLLPRQTRGEAGTNTHHVPVDPALRARLADRSTSRSRGAAKPCGPETAPSPPVSPAIHGPKACRRQPPSGPSSMWYHSSCPNWPLPGWSSSARRTRRRPDCFPTGERRSPLSATS